MDGGRATGGGGAEAGNGGEGGGVGEAEAGGGWSVDDWAELEARLGEGKERACPLSLGQGCVGLEDLPPELLTRVLARLSARDLCALSATSRRLSVASREAGLWEHLCRCRFPSEALDGWETANRVGLKPGLLNWKRSYFALAEREVGEHAGAGLPQDPDVARGWRELTRALWDMPPPPRHPRYLASSSSSPSSVHPLVATFRRKKNLCGPRGERLRSAGVAGPAGGCPAKGGRACEFEVLAAGLAACLHCGVEHCCSDACLELQPDPEGANLVCSITGRCCGVAGLDAPGSSGGGDRDRDHDREPEDEGFFTERGALGRAYAAGYSAAAHGEPDLRRLGFGL